MPLRLKKCYRLLNGIALTAVLFFSITAHAQASSVTPSDIWQRSNLLGDLGGIQPWLNKYGISLSLSETAESLGNITGGVHRGFIYDGRLDSALSVDLDKAIHWPGAQFFADAYQIQGHGLSGTNLDNYFTASTIEANRATRLHDLYLQQTLLSGALSVRLGQIAADDEFIISQYGGNFVNAMFGWPGLPSNDIIPTGGPIYPFASPGIRVKYTPSGPWSVMAGAFTANPAGPLTSGNGNPNPQLRDPSGIAFTFNSALFAISEIAYSFAPDQNTPGLPATYKLGVWYDSGTFPDEQNAARTHTGDASLYAIVDQMLWRRPGTAGLGLAGFLRLMAAPTDRNPFSYYVDGGFNLLGTFPGRDNDIAGIAVAYGAISDDLQDFDRAQSEASVGSMPVQNYESVLELTYQAQLAPWWTIQPDFQYVFHPGGNVADPLDSSQPIGDAAVLGLRTTVTF